MIHNALKGCYNNCYIFINVYNQTFQVVRNGSANFFLIYVCVCMCIHYDEHPCVPKIITIHVIEPPLI